MHNKSKKRICVAMVSVLICAMLSIGAVSVNAAESTLGTQTPAITATYTDANGEAADGNALASGTYEMAIVVSDLAALSQMEITASYDSTVLSFGRAVTAAEEYPSLTDFGPQTVNSRFVYGLTSADKTETVFADNSAVLLTVQITVTTDSTVDMSEVMTVNEDPNFTFIEVSFDDRVPTGDSYIYNCYALGTAENFPGETYPMTCDLSPEVSTGYTVSAYVGALTSPEKEYGTYATTGAIVSISTEDKEISAVTDENGKFVLENVPNGEYTATITYKYGFERTFTIIVNGTNVVSETMVGIVPCNWNGDDYININDYISYLALALTDKTDENYDLGVDITRDGYININDYVVYLSFALEDTSSITYADTVIS